MIKKASTNWGVAGLVLLGATLCTSFTADWPQWRGPERTAHSPETGLLRAWPKEGPKLLWQNKEVGGGYGTPAIVGETIYIVGNEGMDNEFLLALSVKEGRKLWSTKIGKVGHPEQEPKYPGGRSTPTVEGGRVYVLGSDGDLLCADAANGKEVWRRHLRTEFGGKYGQWAYSESPLVDGNAVVCTPGGPEATIVALNKADGKVIWKCALPSADCRSSPRIWGSSRPRCMNCVTARACLACASFSSDSDSRTARIFRTDSKSAPWFIPGRTTTTHRAAGSKRHRRTNGSSHAHTSAMTAATSRGR